MAEGATAPECLHHAINQKVGAGLVNEDVAITLHADSVRLGSLTSLDAIAFAGLCT